MTGPSLYFTESNYEFKGCFKDSAQRDLPVDQGGPKDIQECADACSGYQYFGRQWTKECWCGNSYGSLGEETGCNCDENASNMGGEFHGIHDIVIRVLVVADLVWLLGWQPQRVEKGRTDRSSRNKHTDIIQSPPVLSYLQFHVASVQVSNEINDLDCHLYIVGPTPWHRT